MTDLPPGWVRATIGDLLLGIEAGKSFQCEPRPARPGEWGVIKVSAMTWGEFREAENKAVPPDREFNPAHEIKPGDILVSRANTSEYVGAPVLVGECRPRLLLSDKSLRLKPSQYVDRRWLLHLLSCPAIRRTISRRATGTKDSMRNISQQSLVGIDIMVPPLAEQRRIAGILEDHLSRLDVAERLLWDVRARLVKFGESVLADAVTGRLAASPFLVDPETIRSEILRKRMRLYGSGDKRGRPVPLPPSKDHGMDFPPNWAVMSLEEVTHPVRTISYGILKPGPNLHDGVPYVRVVNMRGDRIAIEDLHRTSPAIDEQYARARLCEDDVLVSIRGTYGRVAVVPARLAGANITQDAARLAFIEGIEPRFAAIYLRSPQVQRHLRQIARGVAVKGVNIGDLREIPFPVPPIQEQQSIVQEVDRLISEQCSGFAAVVVALRQEKQLRSALLNGAFLGQLASRSPEDEPASILLKRIQAERAAVSPRAKAHRPRRKTSHAPQKETLL